MHKHIAIGHVKTPTNDPFCRLSSTDASLLAGIDAMFAQLAHCAKIK